MKINISGTSASGKAGPDGMVCLEGPLEVWRTPSSSRQGVMHFTVMNLDEGNYPQCSCEGFTYRGKCKHADWLFANFKEAEADFANKFSTYKPAPVENEKDKDAQ